MGSCTTLAIQTEDGNDTNTCNTLATTIKKSTDVSNAGYVKSRFCEGILPTQRKT